MTDGRPTDAALLPPGTPVDRTNCDREPIHVPGAVTSAGVLLCVRVDTGAVVQRSANVGELLEDAELGSVVDDLLGTGALADLQGTLTDRTARLLPAGQGALRRTVEAWCYRPDPRLLVIELQPAIAGVAGPAELPGAVTALLRRLQGATTVQGLLDAAVRGMRELTGFDRVWAYRFEPDEHGVIVAEAAESGVPPFLGLHYPAGDIPPQARALYLRNRVRVIPDVLATQVPVEPLENPVTGSWLDQTDGVLRAVSPMHVRYLENMGVRASMSVAVAVEGRLWGLLSAHDYRGPRAVPAPLRTSCELLGLVLPMQLVALAEADRARTALATEADRTATVDSVVGSPTVVDGLAAAGERLLAVCGAEGAVVRIGGAVRLVGDAPPREQAAVLLAWLDQRPADDPAAPVVSVATGQEPELAALTAQTSGVLAVPLSRAQGNWIAWVRPEYERTVVWGASAAPVTVERDGQLRLAPRESFELWREAVRGTSRPWSAGDVASAQLLRSALGTHVVARAEELSRMATRLAQVNEELEAFAYAAAHDLKEPLRGIHVYASFLAEDYTETLDGPGRNRLQAILALSTRMGSMINSLLDFSRSAQGDLHPMPLDLSALVDRARELVAARLEAAGGRILLEDPGPPGALQGDPDRVVDVLANLFANALKYRATAPAEIRVGVRPLRETGRGPELVPASVTAAREAVAVYVADNGIGIAPEHQEEVFRIFRRIEHRDATDAFGGVGAGLAVCRRIVQRHGGVIWVESVPGQGATFYFTLAP